MSGQADVAAEQSGDSQQPSTLALLGALGHLVSYNMLFAMVNGLKTPVSNYLTLNYLASRRSGLPVADTRCDLSMDPQPCKDAVLDLNDIATLISIGTPLIDAALVPAIGALSDCLGRRRVLLSYQVATLVPLLAFALVLAGKLNIYVAIILNIIFNTAPIDAVINAACIDRMPDASNRAAAMGLLQSCSTLAHLAGLFLGYGLALHSGFRMTVTLAIVTLLFVIFLFPETLKDAKQHSLTMRSMVPGVSLLILVRSKLMVRMTLILMLASVCNGGFERITPFFLKRKMDWTLKTEYLNLILADASIIVWFGLLFRVLVERIGEVGCLFFSRTCAVVFGCITFMASHPGQALAASGLLIGPLQFMTPAVAALKSRMVSESEQGAMQGALNAAVNLAGTAGTALLGAVYGSVSRRGDDALTTRVLVSIAAGLTLPTLLLIWDLQQALQEAARGGRDPFQASLADGAPQSAGGGTFAA